MLFRDLGNSWGHQLRPLVFQELRVVCDLINFTLKMVHYLLGRVIVSAGFFHDSFQEGLFFVGSQSIIKVLWLVQGIIQHQLLTEEKQASQILHECEC